MSHREQRNVQNFEHLSVAVDSFYFLNTNVPIQLSFALSAVEYFYLFCLKCFYIRIKLLLYTRTFSFVTEDFFSAKENIHGIVSICLSKMQIYSHIYSHLA